MQVLLNKTLITAFLLILSHNSYAKVDIKKEQRERFLALDIVKNYVKSIACDTSFEPLSKDSGLSKRTTIQDVFTINAPKLDEQAYYNQSKYYVLWQGNMGCEYANTPAVSEAYHVTEVVSSIGPMYKSKPLTVKIYSDYDISLNHTLNDAFQFEKNNILNFTIDKITKISEGVFEIKHGDHDKNDPSNFPSLSVRTILAFNDSDQEWHVISRKVEKADDYYEVED